MNCEEVRELVQRDLDGDLNEMDQEKLKKHLLICEECRVFHEKMLEIHLGLVSLPKVNPPYSLVERILPRLEEFDREEEAKKSKRRSIFNRPSIRYLSVAAVFVLITISFIQWMYGWKSEEKTDMGREVQSVTTSSKDHQAPPSQRFSLQDETATERKQKEERDLGKSQDSSPPPQEKEPDEPKSHFVARGDSGNHQSVKTPSTSPQTSLVAPQDPLPASNTPSAKGSEESKRMTEEPSVNEISGKGEGMAISPPPEQVAPLDPVMGITATLMGDVNPEVIPSPDKSKRALITPIQIEFQNEKGETIYTLTANPGETFKNLTWIDENKVHYEVLKEDGSIMQLELDLEKEQTVQTEKP
ncbi:MAG: zf-HC2 domain-containing protein [Thermicanus sp.]|nr:zf-HC2 domain-containing protein [Thermicanus sp.]